MELRRSGQDGLAFEAFASASSRAHSPRARAQMGLAAQALGRWLDADLFVREALAAADDAWVIERRRVLSQALDEIDAHLGALDVVCNVSGAEVIVDGASRGVTPLAAPLRVTAGGVALTLRATGFVEVTRPVLVRAGETSRETVALVATPAATPLDARPPASPPVVPPTSRGSSLRWVGLAAAGAGVIAAGVGVGLYLDVDAQYAACVATRCSNDARPRGEDAASVALLWGGAALAVGGLTMFLLAPRGATAEPRAYLTVHPHGLGVGGSF